MKNYVSKFEFKLGKFAYIQEPRFIASATTFLRLAKSRWKHPSYYFHLRKGGHVTALKMHSGNQIFAHLDISNFFPSITKTKIIRALKGIGFSYADAREFAGESTVWIDDQLVLPYGFIQSPFLATLALDKSAMGGAFRHIRSIGVRLSVYMDDIVVSHPDSINALEEVIHVLNASADESGFKFNRGKYQPPADSVTAFNIKLSQHHLVLTQEKFDEFYERIMMFGRSPRTLATVGYAGTVNPAQAAALRARLPAPSAP